MLQPTDILAKLINAVERNTAADMNTITRAIPSRAQPNASLFPWYGFLIFSIHVIAVGVAGAVIVFGGSEAPGAAIYRNHCSTGVRFLILSSSSYYLCLLTDRLHRLQCKVRRHKQHCLAVYSPYVADKNSRTFYVTGVLSRKHTYGIYQVAS